METKVRIPKADIPADAEFWLNEDNNVVAALDGKAWLVIPEGLVLRPNNWPLTGEEPWIKALTSEEAFAMVEERWAGPAAARLAAAG